MIVLCIILIRPNQTLYYMNTRITIELLQHAKASWSICRELGNNIITEEEWAEYLALSILCRELGWGGLI